MKRQKTRQTRMHVTINEESYRFLNDFAEAEGCSATEVVRRGLLVLRAFRQQKAIGRSHIGFVSDPSKLEAEIIGLIT